MTLRRNITAWTLIAVLLTHSLGINLLYEFYALDKPHFVELFCVNKDQPELECDGSCMLAKMMEQQQKDTDKSLPDITQFKLIYYFQTVVFKVKNLKIHKTKHYFFYHNFYESLPLKDIFKPPILV